VEVAKRPHIKTHKLPVLAKMQIAAGAIGITCQYLGGTEVSLDSGITDIIIAADFKQNTYACRNDSSSSEGAALPSRWPRRECPSTTSPRIP